MNISVPNFKVSAVNISRTRPVVDQQMSQFDTKSTDQKILHLLDEDFDLLEEPESPQIVRKHENSISAAQKTINTSLTQKSIEQKSNMNSSTHKYFSIRDFEPNTKREINRIPIHEVYTRQVDNKTIQDEIAKVKARMLKLKDEQQQAQVQMKQVDQQIDKIYTRRIEKQTQQIQEQQKIEEKQAQINKLREENQFRELQIKKKQLDGKLKIIEQKKIQAQEVRIASQLVRQQNVKDYEENIRAKREHTAEIRKWQPTWQGRMETKIENIKTQYYKDQYAMIQKVEAERAEFIEELNKLQQEEKVLLEQTLKVKEKRSIKIQKLDAMLTGSDL
ncbi:Conserved_hypothetical protein [Hexamita inflata]|uniref:Uncharacterized protein n=1 Tax=Hexamita inflata TaxID=28002 RepID=A0AA86P8C9_9EUKA|nr:Conserved hypothetical protein [Hexamita inflata]